MRKFKTPRRCSRPLAAVSVLIARRERRGYADLTGAGAAPATKQQTQAIARTITRVARPPPGGLFFCEVRRNNYFRGEAIKQRDPALSVESQRHARETVMRLSLIALAVAAGMAAAGSAAYAQNYPWCAQYGDGMGGSNCGFTTLAQCQEDVSGIGGFCEQNNTYVPPLAPAPNRAARHHPQKSS